MVPKTVSRVFVGLMLVSAPSGAQPKEPLVVASVLSTTPLFNYEGAPGTPDADDPAIWLDRRDPRKSLVIGTAKDAGLLVYDLTGRLIQAVRPPNAPQVLPADPHTPTGVNTAPDRPCIDSANRATFGRFNNVDIAYNVRLGEQLADIAVVSDRGCDRVRFYRIDRTAPGGPLVDVTAPVATVPGQTLMLASSQGDSSFHFYLIGHRTIRHAGAFFIEDVGDTDGVHYLPVAVTPRYPLGLLVVQNGEAPEPDDTSPVNGYEFDGATQFKYVNFLETLKALLP